MDRLVAVAMVCLATLACASCSRADAFVVVVNECADTVIVDDQAWYGEMSVEPGRALGFTFESRPALSLHSGDAPPVGIDLDAWPDRFSSDDAGLIIVRGATCTGDRVSPVMTLIPDDEIDRLYGDVLAPATR